MNDVDPYINRLKVQKEKFDFDVECVGLDAGHNVVNICRELFTMELKEKWDIAEVVSRKANLESINLHT